MHYFFLWHLALSIKLLRFIHVIAHTNSSFLLLLNSIPLDDCANKLILHLLDYLVFGNYK